MKRLHIWRPLTVLVLTCIGTPLLLFAQDSQPARNSQSVALSNTDPENCPFNKDEISQMLQYLKEERDIVTESDYPCIKLAFRTLARARVPQAIPVLMAYIDYERPLTEGERFGVFHHGAGVDQTYPATLAISEIGEAAVPALLSAIENPRSPLQGNNATVTLGMIYSMNASEAIRLLLKEAAKYNPGDQERRRLLEAATNSVIWCKKAARDACQDLVANSGLAK